MYWHDKHKCFLMVYVDDFKMAGPPAAMKLAWADMRAGMGDHVEIDMDDPAPVSKCLGVNHTIGEKTLPNGVKVQTMTYDHVDFMKLCVKNYKEMAKDDKLKKVSIPFMDDSLKSYIDDDTKPGILSKVACFVLMQVFYGARTARFDLLKVMQGLAAKVSKWTLACDSELFQLMSYIDTTADVKM